MRFAVLLATLLLAVESFAAALQVEQLPALEQAVSNNAVALVEGDDGVYLYSFLGLGSGKTWQDISSSAAVLQPGASRWTALDAVPGSSGRLAASAVAVGGAVWLFGGYTVDADGNEASTAGVYRLRPGESRLQRLSEMPVPVEDSVLLAYQDRYIYMVSGWHDLGNVNLVQVLDTQTLQWAQATPWPGAPVFGHAGGISDGQLLICDGVKIDYPEDGSARQFLPSQQCWRGRIDAQNHRRISWRPAAAHPGAPRYRMAASGDAQQRVVFAGGSVNPYNFNGIGYDGVAATAEKSVFSYSFATGEWQQHGELPQATMDHRGLPNSQGWYYLVGGMQQEQTVTPSVYRFRLDTPQAR